VFLRQPQLETRLLGPPETGRLVISFRCRKYRNLANEYALRQEPAFLLTFLALKKVWRLAVREPPVLV
jgi:hypothetical protein